MKKRKRFIVMVVTKRPRPLWQNVIKRGTTFRSQVRFPKKNIFFFVYSYRGKKIHDSYGGDEASTTIMAKAL